MLKVTTHAAGAVLPVWAKAGARSNSMDEIRDGAVVVSVTAQAEDNAANEAIIEVLARNLNLRRSQFQLFRGAASRQKLFLVTQIPADDLVARIEAALTPTIYEPIDPEI